MKRTLVSPQAAPHLRHVEMTENTEPKIETGDTPEHKARIRHTDLRNEFRTLAEQVAQSKDVIGNWKIPNADKLFPVDIDSRFVDKYFPNAKGGPLYVDEPTTEVKMVKAYEKQKHLKKMGHRSIVIEKDAAFKDLQTSYLDCLEQMGEA